MTIFCMVDGLGANAYSVSRALAMVASLLLAFLALGSPVSPIFAACSIAVAGGGFLYARSRPPRVQDQGDTQPLVVAPAASGETMGMLELEDLYSHGDGVSCLCSSSATSRAQCA